MELILKNYLKSLCFIISTVVSALNASRLVQMTKLERITAFDDSACQVQDSLFSTGVGSLSRCAFMCMERAECLTMFYNQQNGKCRGCTARYSQTSLPTPAAGFIHYHKEQTIPDCDVGWSAFQNSCYKLSPSGTFTDGATYCQTNGAHPVYVETSEENEFLKTFLLEDATQTFWFMGMTDSTQDGVWRYYGTNELVSFLDFYHSEPNDDGSNSQQCAVIISAYGFNYKWADHFCFDTKPTICEK